MIKSGLMMYLLQKHHAASKAGQVLKLNSKGLGENGLIVSSFYYKPCTLTLTCSSYRQKSMS